MRPDGRLTIQTVFDQFERHSFKYQQALREISYNVFTLRLEDSDALMGQLANISCLIDDFHSDFDKFRMLELSRSACSAQASRVGDLSTLGSVCLQAEQSAILQEKERHNLTAAGLTEAELNFVSKANFQTFSVCEDGQLGYRSKTTQTDALARSHDDLAQVYDPPLQRGGKLFKDEKELPKADDKEIEVSEPVANEIDAEKQTTRTDTSGRESGHAQTADATSAPVLAQPGALLQLTLEEHFGARARDLYQSGQLQAAVAFPRDVVNRDATYLFATVAPELCFGEVGLRNRDLKSAFAQIIRAHTDVTQFELNTVYALLCFFLHFRPQYVCDCPPPREILRNLHFFQPTGAMPPYCLVMCQFAVRKAYVNCIESIANVAIPYSFERPLICMTERSACGRDIRFAVNPQEINQLFTELLQATNDWIQGAISTADL